MSHEQFVKFYEEWLPTKPDLDKQLNSIGNDPKSFVAPAVKLGSANGFKFDADDVGKVMMASQAKFMKSGQVTDADLAAVAGGVANFAQFAGASQLNVNIARISA